MSAAVRLARVLSLTLCLVSAPASAGHELPFYPSFYPQEITVETLPPATAAAELEKSALHAYVGGDPFAGREVPAHVRTVDSLGAYLVLTWNPAGGQGRDARCAQARLAASALTLDERSRYRRHPYPVTPYHADYLAHVDRAEAAKTAPAGAGQLPRVRAAGDRPGALARGRWPGEGGPYEWTLEEVDARDLAARSRAVVNGWMGPPWLKEGWFHAWLLYRDHVTDDAARRELSALFQRLTTGGYQGEVERLNLERRLVDRLISGCERMVLGYATRREPYGAEFSAGVENVAWDSHDGLDSPIFLRTVKLKDFPWNGWLRVGVPTRATAAWNPVAGFTDPTGRLLWSAVGDPAFFPVPGGASWIGNRVTIGPVTGTSPPGRVPVPKDGLVPEPGGFREIGEGRFAATKIVYRVLASAFHDGTRMTLADTMSGLLHAYRWARDDAAVGAATASLRNWLVAVRPARVDAIEREFGEVKFATHVQTIEVYGRAPLGDEAQTASVAPPWSVVPWPLLALMDEAVGGKVAAFSEAEARRRGVPWLDLVRDSKVRDRLRARLDQQGPRTPPAIARWVQPDEARERWAALKRFYEQHGHFLVTSGPYMLDKWSDDRTVLAVFRDFSYPLGVGSYDKYAIPRRAYVTRVEPRGDRLEVHGDTEVVQKFMREYRIVRQPLDPAPSDRDAADVPVCRYVVIGAGGEVADAGTAAALGSGVFSLGLKDRLKPGDYTVAIALVLGENTVDPEVRLVSYRVS